MSGEPSQDVVKPEIEWLPEHILDDTNPVADTTGFGGEDRAYFSAYKENIAVYK